mgnify:FL=1
MIKFIKESLRDVYFYTSITWILGFIMIGVLIWNGTHD